MRELKNLSTRPLRETIQQWRNAVKILDDPKQSKKHGDARIVIAAIHKEWARRQTPPIDPSEYFDWPSTDAPVGHGNIDTRGWQPEGVLKCLGYQVGQSGLRTSHRQRILDGLFAGPIPPAFPVDYLREWGPSGTAQRLQKMAETIAALARNVKRKRSAQMETAIDQWERDLEYLYYEYYVEKFRFAWPTTDLI